MSSISPRPSFQIGFKAPSVPISGLAHFVNIPPKSSLGTRLAQRRTAFHLFWLLFCTTKAQKLAAWVSIPPPPPTGARYQLTYLLKPPSLRYPAGIASKQDVLSVPVKLHLVRF